MQLKNKPRKWQGDPAALGINGRDYFCLTRFLPRAESLGLEATGLSRGPLNQGCVLKLHGRSHDYEVHLDGNGQVLLGRTEKDGSRVRLCAGSANTEAQWDRVLAALEASEGRLPCSAGY
jgi:hypothetical protein